MVGGGTVDCRSVASWVGYASRLHSPAPPARPRRQDPPSRRAPRGRWWSRTCLPSGWPPSAGSSCAGRQAAPRSTTGRRGWGPGTSAWRRRRRWMGGGENRRRAWLHSHGALMRAPKRRMRTLHPPSTSPPLLAPAQHPRPAPHLGVGAQAEDVDGGGGVVYRSSHLVHAAQLGVSRRLARLLSRQRGARQPAVGSAAASGSGRVPSAARLWLRGLLPALVLGAKGTAGGGRAGGEVKASTRAPRCDAWWGTLPHSPARGLGGRGLSRHQAGGRQQQRKGHSAHFEGGWSVQS